MNAGVRIGADLHEHAGSAVMVPPIGRTNSIRLRGEATAGRVMVFEQTVPAGTGSTFHLHYDSDEVACILSGEITFRIGDAVSTYGPGECAFVARDVAHAWKNTGATTGTLLFLYTPATAGGLIEEQQHTGRTFASMNERELADLLRRHGWELLEPSPF
jgi:quercetin dioxygenase-like cupin family protein